MLDYTPREVQAWLSFVEKGVKADMVEAATAARVAQADGKDWKRFVEQMTR